MPEEICGAPSFSANGAEEQWWECQLPQGHSKEKQLYDAAGVFVANYREATPHEFVAVATRPTGADPEPSDG